MTKEEISNKILEKNRSGSREDWIKNISDGLEEYASHQPIQQLISWMEERLDGYRACAASRELASCLTKAKELAAAPPDTHCTCKEPLGTTSVNCCNDCGLPVEKWWNASSGNISKPALPDESGVKW